MKALSVNLVLFFGIKHVESGLVETCCGSNYLQPGSCGYVDGYGNFVKISQLTDADAIKVGDDGGSTFWDAKTSSKVASSAITLDAEAV
jgi:hypothetical protein